MSPLLDCRVDIVWEIRQIDNTIVQIVFKVFGALAPAMAVINSKDLYVGPVRYLRLFLWRVDHIQNYSYPIFIILSH